MKQKLLENESRKLRLCTPASWPGEGWREALPSGNGKVGISVYGAVKRETILVNHGNLWHWGKRDSLPDVSWTLEKTRESIKSGNYQTANNITAQALHDAGYQSQLYAPCPLGDIRINMHAEEPFDQYERVLDMENGQVEVNWSFEERKYIRKTFVSRTKGLILLQMKAVNATVDADLWLQLHETYKDDTVRMRQETRVRCYNYADCLVYEAVNKENGRFGIVAKILQSTGEMQLQEKRFLISNASKVEVAFKVYGDMDDIKTPESAVNCLKEINCDYEGLLEEHKKEHQKLFHSTQLRLGDERTFAQSNEHLLLNVYSNGITNELCEKLWNYGRYLFISGTRPDAQPFAMYGLWGGNYQLLWSHHMANINIQMMYWHCITGGYAEFLKCLVDYYYNLLPDLRENARNVFGLDGIYLPAGTTPGYGLMNQIVPVIVNWISGAGWVSQHMYEYYEETEDEELLEKKIFPFMEEAACFYEQYLIKDEEYYQIIPSVSPENTPGNLQNEHLVHMAHANPTAKNAMMDVAVLKEFFRHLISLSEKKKRNLNKIHIWKEIIQKLPPYSVNKDGAVKEWLSEDLEDFYYHRHLSHLYPLFPGKEIMLCENEQLRMAIKKAVDLRVQGGQSGWSLAQMASIYARLYDGNKALEYLECLAKGCLTSTFFALHNDWRNMGLTLNMDDENFEDKSPIQLDANMGFVNAVQEMILQCVPGVVYLLPALPEKWKSGCVKQFGFYGGSVDMEWNVKEKYFCCKLKSKKTQKLKIYFPEFCEKKQMEIELKKSESFEILI